MLTHFYSSMLPSIPLVPHSYSISLRLGPDIAIRRSLLAYHTRLQPSLDTLPLVSGYPTRVPHFHECIYLLFHSLGRQNRRQMVGKWLRLETIGAREP